MLRVIALLALALTVDAVKVKRAQTMEKQAPETADIPQLEKEEETASRRRKPEEQKAAVDPDETADAPKVMDPDDAFPPEEDDKPAKKKKKKSSDDDEPEDPDKEAPAKTYQPPFNLTNGACLASKPDRYVMEITNVAHGSYYIGKIGIGNPPQEMNMLLDTGSDEIVVKGAACESCSGRAYDKTKSTTYKINAPKDDPEHGKEQISYGSGDVWGQHVFDSIYTGPLEAPRMDMLEVTDTTIQEFSETSPEALEVITGMAPGLPEYVGQRLASHMEVRRFSECLPKNSEENGFFVVNDNNPRDKGFSGPFMSMGNYYWAVTVDGMRFDWTEEQKIAKVKGSNKPKKLSKKKFSMLVDTGTTLLSMPQEVMDQLDKALDDIGSDCNEMDKLPALTFEIDGVTHSLPPNTYIAVESSDSGYALDETSHSFKQSPVANDKEYKFKSKVSEQALDRSQKLQNLYFKNRKFVNSKTGAECHLLFTQPITMNSTLGELGILGMPLFRNYIISFDFCQRQIWTKAHHGDCSNVVGATPSNKQGCEDGDWVLCSLQALGAWFVEFFKGIASIFSQEGKPRHGPRLKYIPGSERLSAGAKWLLNQDTSVGGIVEL